MVETEGVIQTMINLGSIYECGRTSRPDHAKAFMQYTKVAAICDAPKALCKPGGMYGRARTKCCSSDKMLIYCKCSSPQ